MKLTGSELIAKTKELKGVSESEKVLACGYFSTSKNGKKRLNFNGYYKAIAIAQGYKSSNENELGVVGKGGRKLSFIAKVQGNGNLLIGKGGRKLSYIAKVQGNGNLLIGKAYTALLDLKAGDEFEIKLGKKQIRLLPSEDS